MNSAATSCSLVTLLQIGDEQAKEEEEDENGFGIVVLPDIKL